MTSCVSTKLDNVQSGLGHRFSKLLMRLWDLKILGGPPLRFIHAIFYVMLKSRDGVSIETKMV